MARKRERIGDVCSVEFWAMSGEDVLGVRDTEEEAEHLRETLGGTHVKRIEWRFDGEWRGGA